MDLVFTRINLVLTRKLQDIVYKNKNDDLRGEEMRTAWRAFSRAFDDLILGSPVVPVLLIVIALLSLAV
jgi:hypothetical protein